MTKYWLIHSELAFFSAFSEFKVFEKLRDNYDYSSEGAYFITICAKDRECLFGEIVDEKMILNDLGKIAFDEWQKTEEIRKNILVDEFVIMPNHLHGILMINEANGKDVLWDGKDVLAKRLYGLKNHFYKKRLQESYRNRF